MGSSDTSSPVCIVTLDTEWDSQQQRSITSKFDLFSVVSADHISWSAVDPDKEEGWISLAHGSLHIHCSYMPIDLVRPLLSENRDDIQNKGNVFVYDNEYVLRKGSDGTGVYHVVFPQRVSPLEIEYPSRGAIKIIHARVLYERPILTWVFEDRLHLRIAMRPIAMDEWRSDKKFERDELYRTATKALKDRVDDSDLVKEIKKNAVNKAFDFVPNALKVYLG
jgi:hypothetical protein